MSSVSFVIVYGVRLVAEKNHLLIKFVPQLLFLHPLPESLFFERKSFGRITNLMNKREFFIKTRVAKSREIPLILCLI